MVCFGPFFEIGPVRTRAMGDPRKQAKYKAGDPIANKW